MIPVEKRCFMFPHVGYHSPLFYSLFFSFVFFSWEAGLAKGKTRVQMLSVVCFASALSERPLPFTFLIDRTCPIIQCDNFMSFPDPECHCCGLRDGYFGLCHQQCQG